MVVTDSVGREGRGRGAGLHAPSMLTRAIPISLVMKQPSAASSPTCAMSSGLHSALRSSSRRGCTGTCELLVASKSSDGP